MKKYNNILITGGAGKLGRIVYEYLESKGYNITLFDQTTPAEANPPWEKECNALFLKGQLTDLGDCMRAISLADAEVIIHLAALPHDSDKYPNCRNISWRRIQRVPEDTTMKSNVMGTYYLMDAARRLNVKKVIFASSFFTLGSGFRVSGKPFQVDKLPIDETHANRPEDTYSLSKLIGEEILKAYARAYDIKCVALRLLGVSFPFRPHKLYTLEEIKRNFANNASIGVSDFDVYQYVDARDVARVCELAIEKDLDSDFEEFFTCTGNSFYDCTAAEMVAAVRPDLAEMAKNIPEGEGIISFKKLRDTFGYEPQFIAKPDNK